jgi:hypothetical protein
LVSCSFNQKRPEYDDLKTQAAFKLVQPIADKIFEDNLYASHINFETLARLPGTEFQPQFNKIISYDINANLVLLPGDYIIPVITFCMKSNGQSPDNHNYVLSQMYGARSKIIRELNLRALPKFTPQDIQILSWSLQSGLSYQELTKTSQQIIDQILPEKKSELKTSIYKKVVNDWNRLSEQSQGLIPSFDDVSSKFLYQIGSSGKKLAELREFRNVLKNTGHDFEKLSQLLIELPGALNQMSQTETPWSRIKDNVYARFLTHGHYLDIGQIQIRVLPPIRQINSEQSSFATLDLTSWQADPLSNGIQPLSFSPLFGYGGVLVVPAIAEAPILATALIGAILSASVIDWEALQKLIQQLNSTKDQNVQKKINEGLQVLNQRHDRLERPLRENGIIDRKTKKTSAKDKPNSRV